jgi:hypothetical protein
MADDCLTKIATLRNTPGLITRSETKKAVTKTFFDQSSLQISAFVVTTELVQPTITLHGIRFMQTGIDQRVVDAAVIDFSDSYGLLHAMRFMIRTARDLDENEHSNVEYTYWTPQRMKLAFWQTDSGKQNVLFDLGPICPGEMFLSIEDLREVFYAIKSCRDCLIENGAKSDTTQAVQSKSLKVLSLEETSLAD